MNYSVVIAVYKNDNLNWFFQAIESLLTQTVGSDDIIIVRDGEVGEDIEDLLNSYETTHTQISIVRLSKNVGAGQARNEGVSKARHEYVAIMDADDISASNRFELQLEEFKLKAHLALIGGQMSEFEDKPSNIVGYRKVPLSYAAIKRFARYRSPVNHVTVMFKKAAFQKVGGYPVITRAEDYCMVSSLLSSGFEMSNLEDTLVNCRINRQNILRRKTWRSVRENIVSRWMIHKHGTSSFVDFCISSLAQLILFVVPTRLLGVLFGLALRSKRG